MNLRTHAAITLGFILMLPSAARAWHDAGHAAVASIAWQDLSRPEDQKTREAIRSLLRQHHDYERFWKPQVESSGLDEGELLLMLSALWPDDIRPPRNEPGQPPKPPHPSHFFHQPSWHFKGRAYIPPGQKKRTLEASGEDIVDALSRSERTLLPGSTANQVSKAIALCWMSHLVGDAHQPLHAASLLSDDFPAGDRGGNSFLIDHSGRNLHSFWDGVFDDLASPLRWSHLARHIMTAEDLSRTKLAAEIAEARPERWMDEGFDLAKKHVYRYTNAQGKEIILTPGVKDRADRPARPLPSGYAENALRVARKRVALSGYRFADKLRRCFPAQ